MRYVTLFICLMLLMVLPVAAQDGYPLPDNLQLITVENAAHIKPLASVGGLLPKDLKWSNNGKMLIVNTSAGAQLYNTAQLQQAPIQISSNDGVYDAYFTDQGELMVNVRQYDPLTGGLISSELFTQPIFSPSGKIKVKIHDEKSEKNIDLIRSSGDTTSLHIPIDDSVSQVVFSPDEQYIVVVASYLLDDYDFLRITLWNVKTGKQIAELPTTMNFLDTVRFHADGKLIIVASYTDAGYCGPCDDVSIWDAQTGLPIEPNSNRHRPIFFSPDGRLMAVLVSDHIDIWTDHRIGWINGSFNLNDGEIPAPFSFSPDSTTIVTTANKKIYLWEIKGEQVSDVPHLTIPTSENVNSFFYNPDGTLLIANEDNQVIEVWDARTGAKQQLFPSTISISSSLKFSLDGQYLRATENGGNTLVWDVYTHKQVASVPANAVFSPDGLQAAYWDGGLVRVVDIPNNQQTTLTVIENNLGRVRVFNPIFGLSAFMRDDSNKLYDLQTGKDITQQTHIANLDSAQFSNNNAYFMTHSEPHDNVEELSIWRTDNLNKPISKIETAPKDGQLLLSPNGKVISELNEDYAECKGTYRLWSTQTNQQSELFSSDSCGQQADAFSPDSKWLLVGWNDSLDVINVDAALGSDPVKSKSTITMYIGDSFAQTRVEGIVFSPDGQTVAIRRWSNFSFEGGPDIHYRVSLVKFSDLLALKDGDDLGQIEIPIEGAQTVLFSPGSHWLLTDVGLWDLTTDKQVATFSASTAAFSPDSSLLAMVNPNTHNVELWDVSKLTTDAASPLTSFESQKTRSIYLNQLAFSPDGKFLYLSYEGDIQLWGVPTSSP